MKRGGKRKGAGRPKKDGSRTNTYIDKSLKDWAVKNKGIQMQDM